METKTLTLPEFLLACIADDEAIAHEVRAERVEIRHDRTRSAELWAGIDSSEPHVAVGHDRVLADCEAKRRIVEYPLHWPSMIRPEYREWTWVPDAGDTQVIAQWTRDENGDLGRLVRRWPKDEYEQKVVQRTESPILRLLALPYADRPGYRDEWRP